MADQPTIFPLTGKPGVKRDGTLLEGNNYTDSLWCRWQRGRPRKMGGYRQLTSQFSGYVRGAYAWSRNGFTNIFGGSGSVLEYISVDPAGASSGINDYTPAGFATSDSNVWQFDAMYNSGGSNAALIAHGAPNLLQIDSNVEVPVYYGAIDVSGSMVTTTKSVSGGACCLQPFLFVYGNDGQIAWSDQNSPTTWASGSAGSARITATKIVKGMQVRGGPGNSPAGLFWSLDSVIRASFIGGAAIFQFDTITSQSSILSSSGVIEYDGLFFWPGVDRFLMYNGVVRELPNDMSVNWFYDNLNWTYRQKVWAMKVPRYGEIWFFFPFGSATECNAAVIYNIRENCWYDTGMFADGAYRSAGIFSQVFRYPVMFDNREDADGKVSCWQHEFGVDKVTDTTSAIRSYFESPEISYPTDGPMQAQHIGVERWTQIDRVEPDFVQSGDITMTILGRRFPNSDDDDATPITISEGTTVVNPRDQRRLLRLKFESNVAGGDYQMGDPLLHVKPGDARP